MKMPTYRSRPNKFPGKFQRSLFFLLSKSETSSAFLPYSKNRPVVWTAKRERAKTNSIRTGPGVPPTSAKSIDITAQNKTDQLKLSNLHRRYLLSLSVSAKDNESGNRTCRKNWESWGFLLQTQPQRAVRLDHIHTQTHTSARAHT